MRSTKGSAKYMTVDDGEKLYLYATDIVARQERESRSYISRPPETAKPLTKKEALRLATTLINFATREGNR